MTTKTVLRTSLCELLGCEYPIMLAGMGSKGRATPPKLVAAVSNAGGFGVLGGSALEPDEIRRRIQQIREMTDKPFGADLLLPATMAEAGESREEARQRLGRDYPRHVEFVRQLMREHNLEEPPAVSEFIMSPTTIREQVDVILEERVPLFAAALGDPSWVVPKAHEVGTKVLGMVGSARNALRQMKAGVDIIVAQGYEAGGHTGRIANFPLIPEVVDLVSPTPVVAAGGIADGRGVAAALCLGAVGVWVGTAFLAAQECDIFEAHQQQILQGDTSDFIISRAYSGKTARGYKNPIKEAWEKSELDPLPMPLQGILMSPLLEAAERAGRYDLIHNAAGQIGGLVKERRPARDILEGMVEHAVRILETLPAVTG